MMAEVLDTEREFIVDKHKRWGSCDGAVVNTLLSLSIRISQSRLRRKRILEVIH
jgi:hypothetical protein